MINPSDIPNELLPFLSFATTHLESSTVDPWEIYKLSNNYPFLYNIIKSHTKELSNAFLENKPDETNALIKKILTEGKTQIQTMSENTPEQVITPIKEQLPVLPHTDLNTEYIHQLRAAQPKTAFAIHAAIGQSAVQTNKKWIQTIVNNWAHAAPKENEPAIATAVEKAVRENPNLTGKELIALAQERIKQNLGVELPSTESAVVNTYKQPDRSEIQHIKEIFTEAILSPKNEPPNIVAETLEWVVRFGGSPEHIVDQTLDIVDKTSSFSISPTEMSAVLSNKSFRVFGSIAQTPWQKTLAPVADAFVALTGINKEALALHLLSSAWSRITEKSFKEIFSSDAIRKIIQSGNETIARGKATNTVLSGPHKFFGDVIVSIFHSEISETYLIAYELMATKDPSHWQNMYAGMPKDVFGFLSRWGLNKMGKAALSKAGKEAGSSLAGKALQFIGGKGIGASIGAAAGSLIPIPVVGNIVGAIVGFIVSDIIGKGLGLIWKGIKGIGKFLSGDMLIRLMEGGGKLDWKKDWPLLGALALVAPLLILFILPTFLSPTYMNEVTRTSAMIEGIAGGESGSPDLEKSQYISVTLTANPTSVQNSELPTTVTFTLTIRATSENISNISVSNLLRSITASGSEEFMSATLGDALQNPMLSTTSLGPGESFSLTFPVTVTQADSAIVFSTVVTADVGGNTEVTAAQTTATIGSPTFGGMFDCKNAGNRIVIPGSTEHILSLSKIPETKNLCIIPTMIVIHWSGGHSNDHGNSATFDTLEDRGLSCQFATDTVGVWQMLPMWEKKALLAYCVGGNYNNMAVNNEIAGSFFDTNPPPENELQMAILNTCALMNQYGISSSQIFGHFQLIPAKPDPGKEFLQMFIERVRSQCGG